VSDRTLCYLASGRPVVVQDTGPSAFLSNGEGMLRLNSLEEADGAIEHVNANYANHCRAARELAEAYFDADKIVARILDVSLGRGSPSSGVGRDGAGGAIDEVVR